MWIKKKEYNRLLDQMDDIRKEYNKIYKENNDLEDELYQVKDTAQTRELYFKNELENKKQMVDTQKEQISRLDRDNNMLIEANKKLTDWINKIINEVGIYEVNDRHSIQIPIYKEERRAIFGNMDDVMKEMPNFINGETIIIPEIKFVRFK